MGYINDSRIKIPKSAYIKDLGSTYTIQPEYRIEFAPAPDTVTTSFGTVQYLSYIYPFHRTIFIDKYVDPWWLYPLEAATRPTEKIRRIIAPTGLPDDQQ